MRKVIADLSRILCRVTGGAPGKTLCWRVSMRWGYDCLFCRCVAKILRHDTHCLEELEVHEIVALKKRK